MREHEEEFEAAGAQLAAIGLGDASYARLFREETGISFPLLIDERRVAYNAASLRSGSILHLLRRDNSTARKRARAKGHQQRGLGRNPFQLGGSFVFAPGNRDVYSHLSETFGDNASVQTLLNASRDPGRRDY